MSRCQQQENLRLKLVVMIISYVCAAGDMPMPRYQHGAVFVNARLHISGGAVGGGRMVEDSASVVTLDTAAGAWVHQEAPEDEDDWASRSVSQ